MNISHTFEVSKPIECVWSFFQDIPEVASCLPGAELVADRGEGAYDGKVSVKLGPMSANFEGTATVVTDGDARTGQIDGKGVDKRGGSRGQVKVTYGLESAGSGTKVNIDANVNLSGAAAQFGRTGLINEMSSRLIGEFVQCVEAKLAATTEDEARMVVAGEVNGLALFFQSLAAWFKRLFSRS